MKKISLPIHRTQVWIAIGLMFCAAMAWAFMSQPVIEKSQVIALLVPDDFEEKAVGIWRHAASEEGMQLEIVTGGAFLRAKKRDYAGVIVPDTIHKSGSSSITTALAEYVNAGGKLMMVFDALTLDSNGTYPLQKSRLSEVVGIDYALYDKYRGETIRRAGIVSDTDELSRIGITPGRYDTEGPIKIGNHVYDKWLTTYRYQDLQYPFFVTESLDPAARIMMATASGHIAALEHQYGKGKSVFVNLPLGSLKNTTDGLLMHSFIRYFSDEVAGLPRLMTSPKGIGGLILNIHVDNGYAIKSLDALKNLGLFEQGPYSIHFTAGPDVNQPGDGMGMNVPSNRITQAWIRNLAAQGHAIGNHGGWIHNYFGTRINENNGEEYSHFLDLNNNALSTLLKHPITEYSAPVGNHPDWVTTWLAQHDVKTYYTTSNLGMGPTRMFKNDVLIDKKTWSIPITPFGRIASFEEAMFTAQPPGPITSWLNDLANYVADNRNIREIYCHPIGVPFYSNSMRELLRAAQELKDQQRFSWYTMTQAADFMSRREQVDWRTGSEERALHLDASHSTSLADMTWQIPIARCAAPAVTRGKARIREGKRHWEVVADDVKELSVTCKSVTTVQ